ncbi:MAG: Coenzyme F420 hydrogenase/dehydrogenase, beta subunit C-terminal domain [Lachnospiraceae bacterium]|nr:Coenzyme F420 hydrogenase/dehydrogenase, beta subunit C-terminal domain [Lachnospiraceae bacterium]
MSKTVLYESKAECCGCEACVNVCPRQAIRMAEDEYGFRYPQTDEDLCTECGLCKRVCAFRNVTETNTPFDTYVACTANTDVLKSASGGMFACLAKSVLEQGGVIFGVSMEYIDGALIPMHICVDKEEDLIKLQGSKYVQSIVGDAYAQVKAQIKLGKKVLFSGTPCQVAGLKSFLGNQMNDNVLLVDIICHGVPSVRFFHDYLKEYEKRVKGKVTGFTFRDKTGGWGLVGKVSYTTEKGKQKSKPVYARESSYYQLFLRGDIYRESCYECKYASNNRPGDISLGDFWGIEREHPDYLAANGGCFDETKGVSCMILNSSKGKEWVERLAGTMTVKESTYEKASAQNGQLRHPTKKSEKRAGILESYVRYGYQEINHRFKKETGVKLPIYCVIDRVPVGLKKKIRRILK